MYSVNKWNLTDTRLPIDSLDWHVGCWSYRNIRRDLVYTVEIDITYSWYSFIFIVTVIYYIGLVYELLLLLSFFLSALLCQFLYVLLCHNIYSSALFSLFTQYAVQHTVARATVIVVLYFSLLNLILYSTQSLSLRKIITNTYNIRSTKLENKAVART